MRTRAEWVPNQEIQIFNVVWGAQECCVRDFEDLYDEHCRPHHHAGLDDFAVILENHLVTIIREGSRE